MQIMNIEKLLNHPFLNRRQFAQVLYPDMSSPNYAPSKLLSKLQGKDKRRITQHDAELIRAVFAQFLQDVEFTAEDLPAQEK